MKTLSGTWVHPADGDGYPEALTMTVAERRDIGVLSWRTSTNHGAEFGVSEWEYVHPLGSNHLLFSVRAKDGKWNPVGVMAPDRWWVEGGEHDTARDVMARFFADAGYEKQP